ncbi:MAG TPA: FAD-linked oxidase C-terminal domain-containing protein [Stellaceae bacterium]|nr:FAD-linked oxidase C-terminal domain-containing protein [Stellaceae bacterium]
MALLSPSLPDEQTAFDRARVAADLRRLLGAQAVIASEEGMKPYECDGLTAYRQLPGVVAIPTSSEELRAVIGYCHERRIPIVPRGAGTSLSGGALPHSQGVLLNLARLNRILSIDPLSRTARVQPGVRNLQISEAAAKFGLFYAPDPSSQIACTIGGNIAENSGGLHCIKYGLTVHNILKIEVVLSNGELVTIGSDALDTPGFDLLALMTGSEGLLGVVAEATVKLLAKPRCVRLVLACFDDIAKAGDAVGNVIARGIIPAGFEMMDNPTIRTVEAFSSSGYDVEAAAVLLCELDGSVEDVEENFGKVQAILRESGATSLRVARDEAERQRFWAGRKGALPAAGRISPDYYCMDGTIPRRHIAVVLARIAELSRQYGLRVTNVFHAGDGNLHPLVLYDASKPKELRIAEELGGKILELCVEMGGTVTGEHGVGAEKLNQMCVQFGADELDQFHAVKRAFDPAGIFNPGKGVPTLHRCAEFGAMHVHKGELRFPDLPRF